jgi:hypothetical protein
VPARLPLTKLSLCSSTSALRHEDVQIQVFLTSKLGGGKWSASSHGRLTPAGERAPGTHCIGGWMGPRAGLDDVPYRNTNSDPSTLGADRNCSRSGAIYRTVDHT